MKFLENGSRPQPPTSPVNTYVSTERDLCLIGHRWIHTFSRHLSLCVDTDKTQVSFCGYIHVLKRHVSHRSLSAGAVRPRRGCMRPWRGRAHMCAMTIRVCAMARAFVCDDLVMCVPCLIHLCAMTHSQVCHDSFICVPWRIRKCAMTHSHVCHVSFVCDDLIMCADHVGHK